MHLPPLDVAVYPIVTMSHGRRGGRSSHSAPAVSSSSSASFASSHTYAPVPDFSSIQTVIRIVSRSSKTTVQRVECLQGRLHQVFLIRLAEDDALVLKCPPNYSIRTLRHEKHGLETERKTLETLRKYTQLPVPQVIKYDSHGGGFGSPFLLLSHVPGRRLSEIASSLTVHERNNIDRTLGSYVRNLTTLTATQFGWTHLVVARKGEKSWRNVFLTLLESALRDAEEMLINVWCENIRYYVERHSHLLDDITEPRLVALNVCDPQNVLVDEQTKLVTGLVGFSQVIWGDPLMSGGISDGNDAFFEGFGECPSRAGGAMARQLMYSLYRATVQIVSHHYRPHLGIDEYEARHSLTSALNLFAHM